VDKKGDMDTATKLIFFAIVAVVIVSIFGGLLVWYNKQSGTTLCKISQLGDQDEIQLTTTTCPSDAYEIRWTDVSASDPKKVEENIKRIVADSLLTCWDRYLKGYSTPFEKESSFFTDIAENVCTPCFEFTFEDKIVEEVGPVVTGFYNYVKNTPIHSEGDTYYYVLYEKLALEIGEGFGQYVLEDDRFHLKFVNTHLANTIDLTRKNIVYYEIFKQGAIRRLGGRAQNRFAFVAPIGYLDCERIVPVKSSTRRSLA
tara:strand:+ start:147 stop:917 length:771 start_codon:yes stop_codon:yes gene_type:complete